MAGVKRPFEDEAVASSTGSNVHHARKRRIDNTEVEGQLRKIYDDLADDVQAVRIKAAGELVRLLSVRSGEQIERTHTVTRRLIKGLRSGRKNARLGFSIALAEVLRLGYGMSLPASLRGLTDLAVQETTVQVNASGQEKRDCLIGRRFALQAIIQSNAGFSRDVPLADWQYFISAVMDLFCQKQWLRRECGAMLCEYLMTAGKTLPADRVQTVVDAFHANSLWKTPEGVALWLILSEQTGAKLPKGIWHHSNPLSANERAHLSKVMQEVPIDDEQTATNGKAAQSGSRQTTPSFAWTVILQDLHSGRRPVSEFDHFWTQVVENGLFAQSSSTERKALGLQILALGIASTPAHTLNVIFQPNIVRCIVSQRGDPQRYLFDAAKAPLNQAMSRTKLDPEATAGLLQGILEHGPVNFDQVTKTKTVETMLSQSSPQVLEHVVHHVHGLMMKPKLKPEEQGQADAQRRMLADMLLSIVRSRKDPKELYAIHNLDQREAVAPSWLKTVLHTFLELGYCDLSKSTSAVPTPSEATRSMCRSRLASCVVQFMHLPLADAATAVYELVQMFRARKDLYYYKNQTKEAKALVKRTDKAMRDVRERAFARWRKPEEASCQAFAMLYAMSVFQIYNEEPDAVSALEDLHACAGDWGKNAESVSVLIELLLSFVSRPSALFRKLAEQVFSAFAASLNADGLQSMVDILGQKESLTGQQEMFDQQDENQDGAMEASGDESAEDVEEMSDVELINGDEVGTNGAVESGSEEEEGESEDEEEDEADEEDDDELAAFNQKLADALGGAGLNDEDEDDDGSDMDDEQMMAVEPALANVFKELKKKSDKKQEGKDAKDNVINFKNRVLDLLMIYVKSQYSNILALDLLMPLTTLIRTTSSKPTAEKAFAVLKQYFEACNKHKSTPHLDNAEVGFAVLQSIHEEMGKGGSKLHANACSRSSLFLSKVLVAMDSKYYKHISEMYGTLQRSWWLDPKTKIHGSVFTEWTSWSIATKKQS